MPEMLDFCSIDPLINLAFAEDIGLGDLTTQATVPETHTAIGQIVAKSPGIVAGLPIAARVFEKLHPNLIFETKAPDGSRVDATTVIATVSGNTHAILVAERTALNFLQRLSGTATLTAAFVSAVAKYKAKIVDTRKTTAGWRAIQKYAVRVGGGRNHRLGLYDGILIKDNHILAAGGITAAIERVRRTAPHTLKIEVEVETLDQVEEALEAGTDILLLDNMSLEMLQAAVEKVAGMAVTEASGGITLDRVEAVAATGVDFISVGALTHSAMPLDISLDLYVTK